MPSNRPIIIKKKKASHGHGHHGGAWKVAYADFVTAMMAFFLVMWAMGLSDSTRRAISGYFREPGVFEYMQGKGAPIEAVGAPQGGDSGESKANKAKPSRIKIRDSLVKLAGKFDGKLAEMAKSNPKLSKLKDSVSVEMTPEGLRIELTESEEIPFFAVGGSEPSAVTREVLATIGPELAALGNALEIEGHTDRRPYPGSHYTNWELSSDRAHAARKILRDNGVADDQFMAVSGYADRRPRKPEDPYDVANRRISIVVRLPPEEAADPGSTAIPDEGSEAHPEPSHDGAEATHAPTGEGKEHEPAAQPPTEHDAHAPKGHEAVERPATEAPAHGAPAKEQPAAHEPAHDTAAERPVEKVEPNKPKGGGVIIVPISDDEIRGAYKKSP
ncbi:OmpA family protein [Myxococcota bacterium]|nr:OmpA family protein [Myxococcota bacterium]